MDNHIDELLLYEFVEGCLEVEERCQVMMHLNQCAHCRKEVSQIKALFYDLSQMPDVEIPDELMCVRESVLTDFVPEVNTKKTNKWMRRWVLKPVEEVIGFIDVPAVSKKIYRWSAKRLQPKKQQRRHFRWLP